MNVDTLLHQYFPVADNVCIELFDEKNIQQVYRRLVEVLIHQPEVETSLLQAMSYCFYEVMDNVLIHSGKTNGIKDRVSDGKGWGSAYIPHPD